MSLKAKIEAVIYAAEEPITLAQLASIFADEALAAKAAAGLPFEVTQQESDEQPASEGVVAADVAPAASDESAATSRPTRVADGRCGSPQTSTPERA